MREKLRAETNENGHEGYNGEMNTTAEEESLECKECKTDSALCEHRQTSPAFIHGAVRGRVLQHCPHPAVAAEGALSCCFQVMG